MECSAPLHVVSIGIASDILESVKSFRDLLEHHIQTRYDGSAAAMSRATGFTTTTISAWRRGKVTLPQIETRRQLANELGVSHLELLVALGELADHEVKLPDDPRSEAVRHLSPVIDRYTWQQGDIDRIARVIQSLGEMREGTFDVPDVEG